MSGRTVAIGIDLGTTKCCVGFVRDGKVEIVENDRGRKTTPSYVAFTSTERLVGDDAKDQVALNPANTVFGVKGLIGRNYEQALTHCQENHLPFSLENSKGKPLIAVKYLGKDVKLAPEQIAAMLLSKMKKLAESHLGYKVADAVISVPAYFNNSQRLATKAAAEIAGLNVLRLINEPTAAALAFKVSRTSLKEETVVMIDIGGGTFDAAVTTINTSSVEVVGVHGDCHFGGQCFDNFLINHFVVEFWHRHERDLRENKKSIERLRIACTKIKHTLTLLPNARHSIDCILGEIDFDVEMTRTAFEDMSSQFIKERMKSVLTLLPSNSRRADCVVAVGGSIRVPEIEFLITQYFNKKLTKTINIDEAVAHGSALLAALLSGDNYVRNVQVLDRTPHMIDVIPTWEEYETLINRSLAMASPISKDVFVNGETTLFEFVYYADHKKTEYNQVGDISLTGQRNYSKKARPIKIQYELDKDAIFRAVIANQPTESNQTPHLANLQLETIHVNDIQRMRQVEVKFEEQQQLRLKQARALSELENLCFALKQNCEHHRELIRGKPKEAMRVCDEVLDCLETTPDAALAVLHEYTTELMKFMR